jgi:protease IV
MMARFLLKETVMIEGPRSRGILGLIWNSLMVFGQGLRNLFWSMFFLGLFVVVVISMIGSIVSKLTDPKLKPSTSLVLELPQSIKEETGVEPSQMLRDKLQGQERNEVELRQLIRGIRLAAHDEKITNLVLMMDGFSSAGLATLREVSRAIEYFKAQGKEVISYAQFYDQQRYVLASHATQIHLDPLGGVAFSGFGRYRQYYREAFDRLGIKPFVIHTGAYKTFAENFSSTRPSKESVEASRYLYNDLWETYLNTIETARGLESGSITSLIENLMTVSKEKNFNFAKLALDNNLVDFLSSTQDFRDAMIAKGVEDTIGDTKVKSFRQISFEEYLQLNPESPVYSGVAIIVAEGGISNGVEGAGGIGGLSTSSTIRRARFDDKVKAIVLRVNSPGGAAFGSELIRRELELVQKAGKPVVVSMGDVAASGGYWISTSSDAIIADQATITGSIGVVGLMLTGEEAMKKLSLHYHGTSTTWIGEAMPDPRRPLDERVKTLIQGSIGKTYDDFLERVANVRSRSVEEVKTVAEGRVWTGSQALDHGLIDAFGGLDEAISKARELAKLDDKTESFYFGREKSTFEKFLNQLQVSMISLSPTFSASVFSMLEQVPMVQDFHWLMTTLKDSQSTTGLPFSPVVHCFCD